MSFKKTIAKWIVLIALCGYLGVILVFANRDYSTRRCASIEVLDLHSRHPADSITYQGVIAELNRYNKHLLDTRAECINTHAIEKRLRRLPNFETVECALTPDGTLRIYVQPIVPEIRVFDGSSSYYVNKDGKIIPSDARFFEDVPVVSGHFSRNFPARSLLPVVRHIRNNDVLSNLVTMISASDPDNIILVPAMRGHVINIGDTTDLDVKFRNLMAMYRRVIPYKGWNTYDTISVKFRGQIVATRADKAVAVHSETFEEDSDPEEVTLPEEDAPNI